MRTARAVTVIQPTINRLSTKHSITTATKRVAAYARVSTDNAEQLTSYEAQVDYYTRYIESKPEWDYVDVYADEGISATSTKNREGFKRMIADAEAGNIDMIITKSVSRFARNTVDTLTTVRRLKEKGVEVYFEKENIYTMDSKGELLITIMSSLAQEESRSISENVKWGKRKQFGDGKVSLPYKHFLGYEKGEDGLPKIVESEAGTVRRIYRLFLEGKTSSGIAKILTQDEIPTPAGKQNWWSSTVKSILKNEKYKGDACLQKSYTIDFLTKKKKKNEGEIAQIYVKDSHAPIVSPEAFELVQEEFERRSAAGKYTSAINCFASRIVCGDCGGFYGRKVWHSTDQYTCTVWQCNNKFQHEEICRTPHLKEEEIKKAFIDAFNSIIKNKKEILRTYKELIKQIADTSKQEIEISEIDVECEVIGALVNTLVTDLARNSIDQKEYDLKYAKFTAAYNSLKLRQQELVSEIARMKARRNRMSAFMKELRKQIGLLDEFDESLWCATLNHMVVKSGNDIVFQFKDGTELPWMIGC